MQLTSCNRNRRLFEALLQDSDPKRFADNIWRNELSLITILQKVVEEDRLAQLYSNALHALIIELVPQHASSQELHNALRDLFYDIAGNPDRYKEIGKLKRRLNEFADKCKRPLKTYEVVYRINNLFLGTMSFSISDVRFFTMTDDELTKWNALGGVSDTGTCHDFTNHTVASTEVLAVDSSRAYETGLQQVRNGLDLLKLAGAGSLLSQLDDEMFLWQIDEWIARPIENSDELMTCGQHRLRRPFMIKNMGQYISNGLTSKYDCLQDIADRSLPNEITQHLQRAIRWISSSIADEELDSKVVGLCTALEIMLLPGYTSGRKGQTIDLRLRLIGGAWKPGEILGLYEIRNMVVHGTASNVARFMDYWNLLGVCLAALKLIVSHARNKRDIDTLQGLINSFETKDKLQQYLRPFKGGTFSGKYAREVKHVAQCCLRELQAHS